MWIILIQTENNTKNNLSLIIDIKSKAMLLRSRLKERWKMLLLLGAIWFLIVFPIPFLPAWGHPIDETSLRTLMIITAIISIPFTLLAIFMNDGGNREHSTY
jgi:O-antigen/teichoic acid export membrane protein